MTGSCTGYHWSHGQYTLANCTQESSTFFIILGFTMLVLLILLGLIFVIACLRQQRRLNAGPSATTTEGRAAGSPGNCVDHMDGPDAEAGQVCGKNLDSVKCVIMAGDDKPTFLAHPVDSSPPKALEHGDAKQEDQEVVGETSQKQQRQDERV